MTIFDDIKKSFNKPITNLKEAFANLSTKFPRINGAGRLIIEMATQSLPGIGPALGFLVGRLIDSKNVNLDEEIKKLIHDNAEIKELIKRNHTDVEGLIKNSLDSIINAALAETDKDIEKESIFAHLNNKMQQNKLKSYEDVKKYFADNPQDMVDIDSKLGDLKTGVSKACKYLTVIDKKIDSLQKGQDEIKNISKSIKDEIARLVEFDWTDNEFDEIFKLQLCELNYDRDGKAVENYTIQVIRLYEDAIKRVDNKAVHDKIGEDLVMILSDKIIEILENIPDNFLGIISNDKTNLTQHMVSMFKELHLTKTFVKMFAMNNAPKFWKKEGERITRFYDTGKIYSDTASNIITGAAGGIVGGVVGGIVGSKIPKGGKK